VTNRDEESAVRPWTLAWVSQHLQVGERVVKAEALHGGITAEMRRLTVGTRNGGTRDLVLRSFVELPLREARRGLAEPGGRRPHPAHGDRCASSWTRRG
jgi:hypothetical protein